MVRRALHREVERDLHAVRRAGVDQAAEIFERAEFGMHGVVAARLAADGIGAAGIVRARPSASCCVPLRLVVPIGWIGVR